MNYCYQCKFAKEYETRRGFYVFCKKRYEKLRPGIRGLQFDTVTKKAMSPACADFQLKNNDQEEK